MVRSVLLAVSLLGAPQEAEVRAQVEALFAEEKYNEAIEICREEYERGGNPVFLYVEAQAERFRGNCDRAVELYVRVLAEASEGDMKDNARDNIEVCAEQLKTDTREEPKPEPEPPPPKVPPPEPEPQPPPDAPADRRAPWWRDPAGGVLVGIGAVSIATGGGLLVGGAARRRAADAEGDEAAFIDGHAFARRLTIAGAIVTGVGAALMVGGIIRYAVVARRPRRTGLTLRF